MKFIYLYKTIRDHKNNGNKQTYEKVDGDDDNNNERRMIPLFILTTIDYFFVHLISISKQKKNKNCNLLLCLDSLKTLQKKFSFLSFFFSTCTTYFGLLYFGNNNNLFVMMDHPKKKKKIQLISFSFTYKKNYSFTYMEKKLHEK